MPGTGLLPAACEQLGNNPAPLHGVIHHSLRTSPPIQILILMNCNELRSTLEKLSHSPKRSLGQNFLVDKNFASYVVRQLSLEGTENILEIGPGLGALTTWLAAGTPKRMVLLEKDRRLCQFLNEKFGGAGLEVREGDALDFDPGTLWNGTPWVLAGNLPYNVSTALLTRFLGPDSPIEKAVVTVQKEVADRIAAKHDTPEYGGYTVSIQRWWNARVVKTVPPDVFFPKPNVVSAVVVLDRKSPKEIFRCAESRLNSLVRTGFHQRRKQLKNLLKIPPQDWAHLADFLGFPPCARAGELSPEQWQRLAALLPGDAPDFNARPEEEIFDIVDDQDRVVSRSPRQLVHKEGLRHRAAHILLRNSRGEFFLQRRAPWKEINPWVWDSSAAGHLDAGEDYATAASRELEEELGVQTPLKKIGKLNPSQQTGNEFIEVFEGFHDGPFALAELEVSAGNFFPAEQIQSWILQNPADFSPVFLLCWQLLRQNQRP